MTLQELLLSRRSWTEEDTIYMVQPWSYEAEAILSSESNSARPPSALGTQSTLAPHVPDGPRGLAGGQTQGGQLAQATNGALDPWCP